MAGHNKINRKKFLAASALTLVTALIASPGVAKADDDHAWVFQNGGGSFTTDVSMPSTTTITQTTDRAIGIGNTSIAGNQTVNILQNGAGSLFVAKDNTGNASAILGRLNANGGVIVLNENGVIFGKDAVINVGSIVASTGHIDDAKFMAGDSKLELTNFGDGKIVNNGTINVSGAGLAALVSPTVVNNGIIQAKLGKVALAAGGEKATVDLYGDGLIELTLGDSKAAAKIENAGGIEGKTVLMTAAAAKDVVDTVINMSGVINASSVSEQGGKIILSGGKNGVVKVSGKLDASGEKGGVINVTGRNVLIDKAAILLADGGQNGDGGDIRVIGDNAAIIEGRFSARGGALGGNGGFVEVSGLNYLDFAMGNVDTTAANGLTGTLLIDPLDITIRGGNGDGHDNGGAAGAGTSGGWENLGTGNSGSIPFAEAGAPFDIYESEIEKQSLTTNIIIQAQRNITTVAGGDNLVTLANNRSLTIETQNNSGNNGSINLTNLGFQVQGTGSMNITAATGTVGTGDVRVGRLLAANGSINVSTDNGQIFLENGAINVSGTGNVGFNASDRIFLDNDITTNGGAVTMEANRFTIDDTDAGASPENLDQIKTNGGNVRITANEVKLGETGGDPAPGEVLIDAGTNGVILFERKTAGSIGLGGAAGDTTLSDAELASLRAQQLLIGSTTESANKVTAIYVDSVNTTANITGQVTLSNYLNQTDGVSSSLFGLGAVDNNNVILYGANKFNTLTVNANDHVIVFNTAKVESAATGNGIIFNADANAQSIGGMFLGGDSSIDTNGKNFTFNGHQAMTGVNAKIDAEGGNILLNNDDVFAAFSADSLVTSGTGTITLNQWDKSFVDGGTALFSAIGSINNAVQALNNTGNGLNTVHVGAGTYDENVIVNQKNILIRSKDGRDTTIVNGSGALAGQGTFEIASGINNVQIGETAHGFTINGFDGPTPGIERAAVYFTGVHDTAKIQGNKIVAQGDEALVTEYGRINNGLYVDGNIFTGNTFTGADGTYGVGDQFTVDNVPRQLVALNQGISNLYFVNNTVTGNSGSQHLVAIESNGANIDNNTFDGLSATTALRLRGSDINVHDNAIDGNGRGRAIWASGVNNLTIGGPLAADGNDIENTGLHAIVVENGTGANVIRNNRIGLLGALNSIGSNVGGGDAILLNNTDGAFIQGNKTANTTGAGAIEVLNSDGVTIGGTTAADGNVIRNSANDGIRMQDDSNIIVENNDIDGTNRVGIWGGWVNGATIKNNLVKNDHLGNYGSIHSDFGSNWTVTGNTIQSGDYGILLNTVTGTNKVDSNTINNVTADAVRVLGTSNLTVSGNNIGLLAGANNIGHDGVHVENSASAKISGNHIQNTQNVGIFLDPSNNSEISGNEIDNTGGDGVIVQDSSGVKVLNNKIGTLGAAGNIHGDGILITGSNNAVIQGNTITKTKSTGYPIGGGIQLINSDGVLIGGAGAGQGNTISNTAWDGIRVSGGSDNLTVTGNTITNVDRDGVYMENVKTGLVNNNTISGAKVYSGVDVAGGKDIVVSGNKVDKTGESAIYGHGVTNLDIKNNFVGLNGGNIGGDGIEVLNSSAAEIIGNSVANAAGNGIFLDPSDGSVISGNTISSVALNGIYSLDNSHIMIGGTTNSDRNFITDVGQNGIMVVGGTENTIQRNVINGTGLGGNATGLTGDGILVKDSTSANILENRIGYKKNGASNYTAVTNSIHGDGVLIVNADDAEIKGNFITNTVSPGYAIGSGIQVLNSDNVVIGGAGSLANTISNTKWDGIRALNGSDNATITNNKITSVERTGIYLENVNVASVVGNDINTTNAYFGIELAGGDDITLDGNEIDKTEQDGIYAHFVGTDGLVIKNNQIGTHGGSIGDNGIEVQSSHGAVITGNKVNDTNANGIYVNASNNVEVGGTTSGLGNTITAAGANGIFVKGGASALVQYNTVKGGNGSFFGAADGAQLDGIHVENNDNVEVLNNTIAAGQGIAFFGLNGGNGANENGIFVSNSNGATIDQNLISGDLLGNGIGAGVDGIHVLASNNLTIGGLTPLLNGNKILSTGNDGIYIDGSTGVLVLNNIIGSGLGGFTLGEIGGDGIDMNNTLGSLVAGNIITHVAGNGVRFYAGSLSGIGLNVITEAGENGIEITNSSLLAVGLNQIATTGKNGIALNGVFLTAVLDNNISKTGEDGIHAALGAGLQIDGNTIKTTGGDGIDAGFVAFVDITNNKIDHTTGDGVRLFLALNAKINDNIITNAKDDGIDAAFVYGLDVNGNTVDLTGANGIKASYVANANINNNKVGLAGNVGGNGIDLRNSAFVTIAANDIGTNVAGNGIFVDPSFNITIHNNDVNGAGADGIHAEDTTNLIISNNRVNDSGNDGVEVHNSTGVELLSNVIKNSGFRGLHVSGQNNGTVVLKGNIFTDNKTGAEFETGIIDLTVTGADRNFFNGGDVGMKFDPTAAGDPHKLVLVNDGTPGFGGTIGETEFNGQTSYYVELANGAFFDPGTPTIINGYHATFDGFRPDTVPFLTLAQFNAINAKLYDYRDDNTLGLFFIGFLPSVDQKDLLKEFGEFGGAAGKFRVTILGLPRISGGATGSFVGGGNIANLLASITPAAGGNDTGKAKAKAGVSDLVNIEPSAGADTAPAASNDNPAAADTACWSQAVAKASSGAAADYSFGGTMEEAISQTASCATGAQF